MRIGTTIILLAVFLITFGYIISDDIGIRQSVSECHVELDTLKQQVGQAQENLNVCQGEYQQTQQESERYENSITSLQEVLVGLETDIEVCRVESETQREQIVILDTKNENLQAENGQLIETNKILEETISQVQSDKLQMWVRIQELETKIANPEENERIAGIPENKVKPSEVILGVILVAQITFTIAQKKRKPEVVQVHQNADYIRLTPHERSLIIRLRRRNKK